jgi:hypothetical protein
MRYKCLDETKCGKSFQTVYGLRAHLLSCESAKQVILSNKIHKKYSEELSKYL